MFRVIDPRKRRISLRFSRLRLRERCCARLADAAWRFCALHHVNLDDGRFVDDSHGRAAPERPYRM